MVCKIKPPTIHTTIHQTKHPKKDYTTSKYIMARVFREYSSKYQGVQKRIHPHIKNYTK